jgi:hypothetical protein
MCGHIHYTVLIGVVWTYIHTGGLKGMKVLASFGLIGRGVKTKDSGSNAQTTRACGEEGIGSDWIPAQHKKHPLGTWATSHGTWTNSVHVWVDFMPPTDNLRMHLGDTPIMMPDLLDCAILNLLHMIKLHAARASMGITAEGKLIGSLLAGTDHHRA